MTDHGQSAGRVARAAKRVQLVHRQSEFTATLLVVVEPDRDRSARPAQSDGQQHPRTTGPIIPGQVRCVEILAREDGQTLERAALAPSRRDGIDPSSSQSTRAFALAAGSGAEHGAPRRLGGRWVVLASPRQSEINSHSIVWPAGQLRPCLSDVAPNDRPAHTLGTPQNTIGNGSATSEPDQKAAARLTHSQTGWSPSIGRKADPQTEPITLTASR